VLWSLDRRILSSCTASNAGSVTVKRRSHLQRGHEVGFAEVGACDGACVEFRVDGQTGDWPDWGRFADQPEVK
jgi:hypothetical protein